VKEILVNLTEDAVSCTICYPQLYGPPVLHMEQKSRSKFLAGVEPRTDHLAIQWTTVHPVACFCQLHFTFWAVLLSRLALCKRL